MDKIPAKVDFTQMSDFDKHYTSRIDFPIAVATTKDGSGKDTGQTVAWSTNVSFNPPVVMISLGKQQYTNESIAKSKIFGLSYLEKSQKEIGTYFGSRSGRKVDKFADIKWPTFRGEKVPVRMFEGCNVCLECKVIEMRDLHYNTLIFGEVQLAHVSKEGVKESLLSRGVTMH